MTTENLDTEMAALVSEESSLHERVRALVDEIQRGLRRDPHGNEAKIAVAEKELRKIVLRLVDIEREQIELRVAASL